MIVTVSEPCDTAAGITRTREPMTTVPVRELTITRAGASPGSISMASSVARYGDALAGIAGAATFTDTPSTGLRRALAQQLVDALGERAAVVKSGNVQVEHDERLGAEARRHFALDGRAVRHASCGRHVDRDARAVLALDAEAADDQAALRDGVDLAVGAAQRRHEQAAAAQRPALPMDDTVTSMVWPGLANGGRSACTVTAATFLSCGLAFGGDGDAEAARACS